MKYNINYLLRKIIKFYDKNVIISNYIQTYLIRILI